LNGLSECRRLSAGMLEIGIGITEEMEAGDLGEDGFTSFE